MGSNYMDSLIQAFQGSPSWLFTSTPLFGKHQQKTSSSSDANPVLIKFCPLKNETKLEKEKGRKKYRNSRREINIQFVGFSSKVQI